MEEILDAMESLRKQTNTTMQLQEHQQLEWQKKQSYL